MHTYLVTFNDGSTETIRSERVEFGASHVVFHDTDNIAGGTRLIAALRADTVRMVEEAPRRGGEA